MKSMIDNIRTKVDKRQIIQYLILRNRVLYDKVINPTNESKEEIRNAKLKSREVNKVLELIRHDKIDKEIRNMHQYIHRQNDYKKKLKEIPEEAVKGMISAMGDVEKGDYTVLTKGSPNVQIANETGRTDEELDEVERLIHEDMEREREEEENAK